jgi:hypothetical protein
VRVIPTNPEQPRSDDFWVSAAGPLANILFGTILLAAVVRADWPFYEQTWRLFAFTASFCFIAAITNMLPFLIEEGGYSDGAQMLQLLTNSPLYDLRRTMNSLASTQVSPRRYRDLDIASIESAASRYPQEFAGLNLQLCAANYYLDSDRLPEARTALAAAESIYNNNSIDLPGRIHPAFVFGEAYLNRDAAAARLWWDRMGAKDPEPCKVDYWLAKAALLWIEGNSNEAKEDWQMAYDDAQKLPESGSAEFDLSRCAMLRKELEQPSQTPVPKIAAKVAAVSAAKSFADRIAVSRPAPVAATPVEAAAPTAAVSFFDRIAPSRPIQVGAAIADAAPEPTMALSLAERIAQAAPVVEAAPITAVESAAVPSFFDRIAPSRPAPVVAPVADAAPKPVAAPTFAERIVPDLIAEPVSVVSTEPVGAPSFLDRIAVSRPTPVAAASTEVAPEPVVALSFFDRIAPSKLTSEVEAISVEAVEPVVAPSFFDRIVARPVPVPTNTAPEPVVYAFAESAAPFSYSDAATPIESSEPAVALSFFERIALARRASLAAAREAAATEPVEAESFAEGNDLPLHAAEMDAPAPVSDPIATPYFPETIAVPRPARIAAAASIEESTPILASAPVVDWTSIDTSDAVAESAPATDWSSVAAKDSIDESAPATDWLPMLATPAPALSEPTSGAVPLRPEPAENARFDPLKILRESASMHKTSQLV